MKHVQRTLAVLATALFAAPLALGQDDSRPRARDIGLSPGVLDPGPHNAITDVPGVLVGQVTLMEGDHIRTGVTAILPHAGNIFQEKVPGAVHIGNAFGKLAGSTQVVELGTIETPIVLTNTLSVWDAARAVVTYTLGLSGNEDVRSVNPLVGETNDGFLNNIRGLHVKESHVHEAIRGASSGAVEEGAVGSGTGTSAFGWKGGIGTSSRRLPERLGGYTVGALIQSNYGGVLVMDGIPVGEELDRYYLRDQLRGGDGAAGDDALDNPDGSIMMVVATDAPIRSLGLTRLARRVMLGLARTGATSSHGSGDFVIAFSSAESLRTGFRSDSPVDEGAVLRGDRLSPLFQAAIEATEEAVYNSMLKATTVVGKNGNTREAISIEDLLEVGAKYNRLHPPGGSR
ncbi:MAG: P1 family peptidase [Acidobacteria bacterium]|nr:P1 family peptidase [Acidobacteriota bacterium]MXX87427.1 P1 family peptidase [Acidobacteriota bacterium]MYE44766.1 P1 family peptidase [Acidobacteriota bacterium]MYG74304.1 P1 family peptidase [Acidobacteriota bacterium]